MKTRPKKYRWTKFHNVFLVEDFMSFPQKWYECTNNWYITKARGNYDYYCEIYNRAYGEDCGVHTIEGMSALLDKPITNLENL